MSPETQEDPHLGKLRFDVYEADPRAGELHKHGVRIPLEDRPFRALLILLRRANEVVTREELKQQLWSSDVFIDFDHGLNTAIRKIRLALNDSADRPRFLETVGRRGYRFLGVVEREAVAAPERSGTENRETDSVIAPHDVPDAVAPIELALPEKKTHFGRKILVLATAACAVILLLAYVFRPAMPLPKVSRVAQLTKGGGAWYLEPLYTDGPRVYYHSVGQTAADWRFKQVLVNGNEDTVTGVPAGRFRIRGLSPDETEFLATSSIGEQWTVWTIPVASGSPHRVGNLIADDITWSHDGSLFAYAQGNQVFLANPDGTSSRLLATVPDASGQIDRVRWSPDDRRIGFTLITATTQALWEIGADGRNLHQLRFNWPGNAMECCGEWMPDGRYFVFRSRREGMSNLWALEEKADWWRRANRDPIQLTFGPMNYYQPVPSRNSKTIFAIGAQPSGELVRYDAGRKDFVTFLGGRSADHLQFSHDGKWLSYVAYPEGTLWRCRSDGTELLQLTFPPLQVVTAQWSPDGKRIVFDARQSGQLLKVFVISAEGGNPEPLPAEPLSQAGPDWMPAGDSVIYGRASGVENTTDMALYRLDLRSRRSEKIPGSAGLFYPLWSPDGHRLAAVDAASAHLFLFDVTTGKRTEIADAASWPTWSADSQYLYFGRMGGRIFRVHVADGKEEKALELTFRLTSASFALAPDGSLVILREHGHYDVYALHLSLP
jgi:Tol biopolymer transport system component/DNA-binding winged helix-turn-helix (wHTH) protein